MSDSPDLRAAVGPRVRVSPFFDRTRAEGLDTVSVYNHLWLPMGFGDPEAEYRRLTEGVAMWDVAAQRHVEIAGPDADAFTQWVTAVDVSDVATGRAVYAPIVDADGILLNDPVLFHWPDGTWRFSIADADLRLWFAGLATASGRDVTITELPTATLAVQGPKAFDVLDDLGLSWARDLDDLHLRAGSVAGIDVVVSRSGWSTQGGVELFLDDPDRAPALWDVVAEAGRAHDIGPGGPNPQERLENVLLSYGTDTGYDADPIELGLADHLDLDGPDFLGRDALRRIRDTGPRRRLRGVAIDGEPMGTLWRPVEVSIGTTTIGLLRAANHSPRFGRNLGLALVDATTDLRTAVTVHLDGGPRRAILVGLPFDEGMNG